MSAFQFGQTEHLAEKEGKEAPSADKFWNEWPTKELGNWKTCHVTPYEANDIKLHLRKKFFDSIFLKQPVLNTPYLEIFLTFNIIYSNDLNSKRQENY